MDHVPPFAWLLIAGGMFPLGVYGLRGLSSIHDALQAVEPARIAPPAHWPAARALLGLALALPVFLITRQLGIVSLVAGVLVAGLAFWMAPQLLTAIRRRLERQLLDELALHLDLLAVAMEAGSSWSSALALCVERSPEGPLRRAWQRVIADIHSGMEPMEALRGLEQRLRLQPFTTLLSSLRAAEKLKLPVSGVLRERARHCAAARFARAERRARAAPLKLWAAMLLCLLPCTAVVLAYPAARWLAKLMA
jgi:tight adherence protein C